MSMVKVERHQITMHVPSVALEDLVIATFYVEGKQMPFIHAHVHKNFGGNYTFPTEEAMMETYEHLAKRTEELYQEG